MIPAVYAIKMKHRYTQINHLKNPGIQQPKKTYFDNICAKVLSADTRLLLSQTEGNLVST